MLLFRRHWWIIFFLLIATGLKAQQPEANIWYFGNFLGLDFNSGTAVPLNNGQINTTEGVATISDSNGNLLFYTDGVKIWNRLHQVMPNGSNLFGSFSSTQSAVIVPFINDRTRYFVFTVDLQAGPRGLCYSVVNMTLNGGNGDVETKNVPLLSNVVEKITAVKHCNNRDIWVLTHGVGSNAYYAFLVTGAGINTTPVISNTGVILPAPSDSATLGYLKASPDGSRIAAAHLNRGSEVSNFNNGSGVVSGTFDLFLPTESHYKPYGIEFSPNSQIVYTTVYYIDPNNAQSKNALLQYDLTQPTPAGIVASKQVISINSDPFQTYAALQVAPDSKMYMAKNQYKHIARIDNPNTLGTGCGFVTNAIQFTGTSQMCTFGLPTFIQSYFYPTDSFTYQTSCPGATFQFNYNPSPRVISVQWNFNDPASGANNVSTLTNPIHQFSAPGSYIVDLIRFTNCGPDTIRKTIQADTLNVNLGPDINQCGTGAVILNPSPVGNTNTYLWQDGSTNASFNATNQGLYWLEVKNNMGCVKRDSINVQYRTAPVFELGPDIPICQNDTIVLNATAGTGTTYIWSTGAITATIKVFQPGLYWCEANNGCTYRDTVRITNTKPAPAISLGNDQQLCEGIGATLNATFPGSTYLWQDGTTTPTFNVTQSGSYHVIVDLNGCKDYDTVRVDYTLKPRFTIGPDQYICTGNTITLSPLLDRNWQLLWQDGSTGPTYTATQPGLVSLEATNQCGSSKDDMSVLKGTCKVYVPSAFTPNKDGKNDDFKALGTESVSKLHLKVFNRWGAVVFETTDKSKGWDGTANGKPLDSGVFIYTLTFTDIMVPDDQQFIKGTVTLVR